MDIFLLLDKTSFLNATCVCHQFKHVSMMIFPGLKLKLYPHQLSSIYWMLNKENRSSERDTYSWKTFKVKKDSDLEYTNNNPPEKVSCNFITGETTLGNPPSFTSLLGGYYFLFILYLFFIYFLFIFYYFIIFFNFLLFTQLITYIQECCATNQGWERP